MFKSKVLLCGVAALVLVIFWLSYEARVVAQQRERAEAARQQDRAEVERKRAEAAERALKEQLAKAQEAEKAARLEAEKARYAGDIRQAQQAQTANQEPEKALAQLTELRAAMHKRFEQERQKLMEQMQKLEVEERETLAKIEAEAGRLQGQFRNRPAGQAAPDGDKLDRILERLDRIEQRLERLERVNRSSGGRK